MHAIVAIENSDFAAEVQGLLKSLDYEVSVCLSKDALKQAVSEQTDIVLCSLVLNGEALIELPACYEGIRWFALDSMSWAAASQLVRLNGFEDVIFERASLSNIFDAVLSHPGSEMGENVGSHARFRWIRLSMMQFDLPENNEYQEKLEELLENGTRTDSAFLQRIDRRFFRKVWYGTFSNTHFASILYRLFVEKCSGKLHLYRNHIHWIFSFADGVPADLVMADADNFFDILPWMSRVDEFSALINDASAEGSRNEFLSGLPDRVHVLKAWIQSSIYEVFSWPEAHFEFCPSQNANDLKPEPLFSETEIHNILMVGVFDWTPAPIILEVTQSCLSYFLKLKDNAKDWGECMSPSVKAVVEKIKKGDNLAEMLAIFPCEYPVHQIVYLYLIMGQLDLIA